MIERLIGFDTTSRLSNLALIEWVRDYLAGYGIESRLIFDDTGAKANLLATIGSGTEGGVVLSGHTDVVPVDGQPWDTDPFQVTEKDGKLYGRGTCDMKSFLAVALTFVPEFKRAALKRPIHLALSYDEEVGCLGAPRLVARIKELGLTPSACIVGEPTDMRVVNGHKGKLSIRGHVRGLECHSSLAPQGVNAVEYAAAAVARLRQMAHQRRDHGPYDARFDPPYTTVHTGTIRGGTALNIVPLDCQFEFEFRHLPGDDPRALERELVTYCQTELEPEMKRVTPDAGFTFEEMASFPGLQVPEEAAVTQLAKQLSGGNDTLKVAFGTEAGIFQSSGIEAIVCGPGSIEQAHKPNEFITVEQVALCERFMQRLIERVSA